MKRNNLTAIINDFDDNLTENFINKSVSNTFAEINFEKIEFDYSWVEFIEDRIVDLDTIVRKPKKFIIQEEEVVPVEKAKKITLETIKHLATHTNLIQEVDEEGTITPSHLLNVFKEESFDIYENRFIYTLLQNLLLFVKKRTEFTLSGSSSKSYKKLEYNGMSDIGSENVQMKLVLEANANDDLNEKNSSGLSISERIAKLTMIIQDFMSSPFIKELSTGQIIPVRSPINKTNTILKNQNFRRALELWEFIEMYNIYEKNEAKDKRKYDNKKDVKSLMDMSFFLDYMLLNKVFDKPNPKVDKTQAQLSLFTKAIREYVNENDKVSDEKFKSFISKELAKAKKEKLDKEKYCIKIYMKEIKKYEEDINNSLALLTLKEKK